MTPPPDNDAMTADHGVEPSAKEVLYSLKELLEDVEEERKHSALATQMVDKLEIEKLFRTNRRKKRSRKQKQSFTQLLESAEPPIPAENRALIEQLQKADDLLGVEQAIEDDLIAKDIACRLWSDHLDVAYVNPLQSIATDEALELVPEDIARKANIVPLYKLDEVLTIATSEPQNADIVRRISQITGHQVSAVFSLPSEITGAIDVYYAHEESVTDSIAQFEKKHGALSTTLSDLELMELANSKSLSNVVDALFHYAIREKASDVHVEPQEGFTRVRFRVDGRLRQILNIPKRLTPPLTSRLKILCNVNIAESRFPQDGRFQMPLGNFKAEFRVSFLPTSFGTKTVVRVLGSTGRKNIMSLDEMLISQKILKPFRRIIRNPNGIVFVTGPTGSGKTTTLYAGLQELNTEDVNISTIEDPIEIGMAGLNQSQVNKHIDLNFPILLRALLRQDPDIILVGEIRDKETAKIATEAALTGHLVFATLHTNNAIQAVVRLIEIGIEPYMVAPSINCVLAQRLAARLDERTKEAYTPRPEQLDTFFRDWRDLEDITLFRPAGSLPKNQSGYKGRVAIHELAIITDEMRSLIAANAGTQELTEAATKMGYKNLRYDGLKKALLGLTSLEEIERATPMEWNA